MFVDSRVADDHCLTATKRQVRQGRFVGHPAGQLEHIGQGIGCCGIGKHPTSTDRWSEIGIVNRNKGL